MVLIGREFWWAAVLIAVGSAPSAAQTLTVSVTGQGKVTAAGIDCPSDCSETLLPTRIGIRRGPPPPIVLTAAPAAGHSFGGWKGRGASCQEGEAAAKCTLTVPAGGAAIYASFVPHRTLTVSVVESGWGIVVSDPPGIQCGRGVSDCSESWPPSTVRLEAKAASLGRLEGWSGDCTRVTGRYFCEVNMAADRTVTATFKLRDEVGVSIVGSGSVASTPAAINCHGSATGVFQETSGTCTAEGLTGYITLSAVPDPGWKFQKWDLFPSSRSQYPPWCDTSGTCRFYVPSVIGTMAYFVLAP